MTRAARAPATAKTKAKAPVRASKAKTPTPKAPVAKPRRSASKAVPSAKTPAKRAGSAPKATPKRKTAPARAAARRPAARPKTRPAKAKSPNLGPHEATYSFTAFRSQLEARWAIFFDVMGWDWDYEPCHYPVGADLGYLPDFYLPGLRLWVEGKGPTFLDNAGMGKILNGAAGPQPLPLRDPPYWPNNGILLLGPMQPLPERGSPVHTYVLPHTVEQTAAAWRSTLTPIGPDLLGKKPWATWPANGIKPARRPGPTQNKLLLLPEAERSFDPHPRILQAYRVALATKFGSKGETLLPDLPGVDHLRHRRRGRPYQPGGVLAA